MQIGHRVLGSYDMRLQENTKMENSKAAEQLNQAQSSADISGLKEGSVFKGKILDIAGEKVTIVLDDQANLTARLQEGVELGVGDQLLFSVKENNSSQILIKPLFDSLYSAQTQVLEKALDMAGLSPTEKNFSAAKELMEAGMPVDKNSMVKILSQSMKFPGASMQTLVALNKMNIPVTEANLAQYERYQNYSHQLSGDIANTADSMASFAELFSPDTSGASLLSVANEILGIFISDIPKNNDSLDSINSSNALTAEEAVSVQEEALTKGENPQEMGELNGKEQSDTVISDKLGTNETGRKDAGLSQFAEKTGLTKEEMIRLQSTLHKVGISEEQIYNIQRQSSSSEELLKNMIQTLSSTSASDAAVRNMLESTEFKKLFSDIIKKNWTLNPQNMKDPKEIDELYEKILKQGRAFEEAIAAKGGDAKNFNQNFQNMRQNMQFMEQLNNQMIYAQMPLKLSNQNANSELYVYADKRKLAQKKDGISVMLHLDMDHLGQTDIKVTLTGTNVNARFYLNDQKSVDIVAENMNQLAKQLSDRGFSLTNEVIKRQPQESINKVVDEIIDESAERSIKRYTFDART